MPRTVGIGHQDFEQLIASNNFYIDKTMFLKEWWENEDEVTLITRPRRFGKTLNISMVEQFFSVDYAGRSDLFKNMKIWEDEKYHSLQGKFPVISLSFSGVKGSDFTDTRRQICQEISDIYSRYWFLLNEEGILNEREKEFFHLISRDMDNDVAAVSIKKCLRQWRDIMERKLLFCWMSMILQCRKLMYMVIGRKLCPL